MSVRTLTDQEYNDVAATLVLDDQLRRIVERRYRESFVVLHTDHSVNIDTWIEWLFVTRLKVVNLICFAVQYNYTLDLKEDGGVDIRKGALLSMRDLDEILGQIAYNCCTNSGWNMLPELESKTLETLRHVCARKRLEAMA